MTIDECITKLTWHYRHAKVYLLGPSSTQVPQETLNAVELELQALVASERAAAEKAEREQKQLGCPWATWDELRADLESIIASERAAVADERERCADILRAASLAEYKAGNLGLSREFRLQKDAILRPAPGAGTEASKCPPCKGSGVEEDGSDEIHACLPCKGSGKRSGAER